MKVLTCFDVPEHPFPTAGHPWSMDPDHQDVADRHLLNRHVRYYGDDVAVVIAENEVAAMQGVRALQVEYEELPYACFGVVLAAITVGLNVQPSVTSSVVPSA